MLNNYNEWHKYYKREAYYCIFCGRMNKSYCCDSCKTTVSNEAQAEFKMIEKEKMEIFIKNYLKICQ